MTVLKGLLKNLGLRTRIALCVVTGTASGKDPRCRAQCWVRGTKIHSDSSIWDLTLHDKGSLMGGIPRIQQEFDRNILTVIFLLCSSDSLFGVPVEVTIHYWGIWTTRVGLKAGRP